mgnify:CR=1 FL=1
MEIDWFTVTAQLVNFLVLVWLLHKFLYGPIIDAMDAREERIADRLESAEELEDQARLQIDEYEQEKAELERTREHVIEAAEDEAAERRRELLEDAREEIDRVKSEWYASLRREQRTVLEDIRHQTERQLFSTLQKVLDDLADDTLERRIIEVFLRKLDEASDDELPEIDEQTDKLAVRTSIELSEDQKKRLEIALGERLDRDLELQFRVDEGLIGGIEIRAHGRRFGWSIRQYLEALEHTLDTRLRSRLGQSEDTPEPSEQPLEEQAS